MDIMNFLITGGAGFIGGHLTEKLLSLGHKVTVIDNYSTGSPRNLAKVRSNSDLQVIEEDLLEAVDLEKLITETAAHLLEIDWATFQTIGCIEE